MSRYAEIHKVRDEAIAVLKTLTDWRIKKDDGTEIVLYHPDWPNDDHGPAGLQYVDFKLGSTRNVLLRRSTADRWLKATPQNIKAVCQKVADIAAVRV